MGTDSFFMPRHLFISLNSLSYAINKQKVTVWHFFQNDKLFYAWLIGSSISCRYNVRDFQKSVRIFVEKLDLQWCSNNNNDVSMIMKIELAWKKCVCNNNGGGYEGADSRPAHNTNLWRHAISSQKIVFFFASATVKFGRNVFLWVERSVLCWWHFYLK